MAACLACGYPHARVVESQVVVIETRQVDGTTIAVRVCYRVTQCPPPPRGCGERGEDEIRRRSARRYLKKCPNS